MADQHAQQDELAALGAQIAELSREPIDFGLSDTAMVREKVRLLAAVATYFNVLLAREYGSQAGTSPRAGRVEQAVGVFQHFYGNDPHPAPFEKAGMLLRGIALGRTFADGNQRTGFLVAAYYLVLVGHRLPPELDVTGAEELCRRVAAGQLREVHVLATELERLWGSGLEPRPSSMQVPCKP